MRGTFTPIYAGGTVSPGGMVTPIGAMSLSSRYETPRSSVLGEGGVMVEEKSDLDVVNRKTQEPERIWVIGEDEDKKGFKMDVDVDVRG